MSKVNSKYLCRCGGVRVLSLMRLETLARQPDNNCIAPPGRSLYLANSCMALANTPSGNDVLDGLEDAHRLVGCTVLRYAWLAAFVSHAIWQEQTMPKASPIHGCIAKLATDTCAWQRTHDVHAVCNSWQTTMLKLGVQVACFRHPKLEVCC